MEEQVPIAFRKMNLPICPHAIDPISGLAYTNTSDGTRNSLLKDGVSIGDNYNVADHESIWQSHLPFVIDNFASQSEEDRLKNMANRYHGPTSFYEPHTIDFVRGRNFRKF